METSFVYKCTSGDIAPRGCVPSHEIGDSSLVLMCPSKEIGVLTNCKKEEAQSLTMDYFIRVWGDPRSRGTKDGLEYLEYNKGIAWRGAIVLFIVIPVPVLYPAGHNKTTLLFKNDKLISTINEYGDLKRKSD